MMASSDRDPETQEIIDERGKRLDSLEANRYRMTGLTWAIMSVVLIFSIGSGLISLVNIQQGNSSSDDIVNLGLAALGVIGTITGYMAGSEKGRKS